MYLDGYTPKPGERSEGFELHTRQGTLSFLRNGGGGKRGRWGVGGKWEEERRWKLCFLFYIK